MCTVNSVTWLSRSMPEYITGRFSPTADEDFSSGISYRSLWKTHYRKVVFSLMFKCSWKFLGEQSNAGDCVNLKIGHI